MHEELIMKKVSKKKELNEYKPGGKSTGGFAVDLNLDFSELKEVLLGLEKEVLNQDQLMPTIISRFTKEIGNTLVSACDLVMRLRLGQMGYVFQQAAQLFKVKPENIKRCRQELHELVDYLCENSKLEDYPNEKLRSILTRLDSKSNGYPFAQCIDIEESLYKALELAEFIVCYGRYGKCSKAQDCWVTRRGFGQCPHIKEKGRKG